MSESTAPVITSGKIAAYAESIVPAHRLHRRSLRSSLSDDGTAGPSSSDETKGPSFPKPAASSVAAAVYQDVNKLFLQVPDVSKNVAEESGREMLRSSERITDLKSGRKTCRQPDIMLEEVAKLPDGQIIDLDSAQSCWQPLGRRSSMQLLTGQTQNWARIRLHAEDTTVPGACDPLGTYWVGPLPTFRLYSGHSDHGCVKIAGR